MAGCEVPTFSANSFWPTWDLVSICKLDAPYVVFCEEIPLGNQLNSSPVNQQLTGEITQLQEQLSEQLTICELIIDFCCWLLI